MLQVRLLILLAVGVAGARGQLSPGTLTEIDGAARKALKDTQSPALGIAIVQGGRVALEKAYGAGRLEPYTPANTAMRFSIGSVSKQFLASAMLLLAEGGKLSLDDRVGKYLTGLTRGNDITIRQLLSHTSGYQDYYPQDYVPPFMLEPVTADGIIDRWGRKPLDFEPGTQWQYSNTGFVIAGKIVEKVTGKPLIDFLRARIFSPLAMTSVIDLATQTPGKQDAAGYLRYALGPMRLAKPEAAGWLFAAGELAMTPGDLARWDAGLMSGRVLSDRSFRQLTSGTRLLNGADTGYGLGVRVANQDGLLRVTHAGEVAGFAASNTLWPDQKAAIVVLSNQDVSKAPGQLTEELRKIILKPALETNANQLLQEAKKMFSGLQEGKIDRSALTANCSAYFTDLALHDYAASLKPLGIPRIFEAAGSGMRGGFSERYYRLLFARQTLRLAVRSDAQGKIEQFEVLQ